MVVDYLDHLFPMCQFYVHKETTIRNAISTLERIQTFHVTEKISLLHLNTKAKDVSNLQKTCTMYCGIMQPVLELEVKKKDRTRGLTDRPLG